MKVLMIGPDLNARGGISSVVQGYIDNGLSRKCELTYLSSTCSDNVFKKIKTYIKSISKSKKLIKENDIIHIHVSKNGSFFRKYYFIKKAHKYNRKIILHIHSSKFIEFYKSNKFVKKRISRAFEISDKVIVLSNYWKEQFEKICDKSKLFVLYNGIPYHEKYNKDYKNENVLFLGRICKEKGIGDLLKSMSYILQKFPNTQLYIGGLGDIKQYKFLSEKLNIDSNVHWLGWINNKEKYLKECSVFILPSYHEGMPVSLLEGMTYGCACIATNVGAIPEIVDNQQAILIKPGKIDDLSNAIISIISNTQKKKKMGDSAQLTIKQKYNIDIIINKLVKLYNDIINYEKR